MSRTGSAVRPDPGDGQAPLPVLRKTAPTSLDVRRAPTGLAEATIGTLREVCECRPAPLAQPRVAEHFDRFGLAERSVEAIRYNVACFEYAVSPSGRLRAWTRTLAGLCVFVLVPLLGLWVVVSAAAPGFAGVATIAASVAATVRSTFVAVVYTGLTVAVLWGFYQVYKAWERSQKERGSL